MKESLLMGIWRFLLPLPTQLWKSQLPKRVQHSYASLSFMSEDHHRVRNFVVTEIPRTGKPLSPTFISQELSIPEGKLAIILDELEKGMTFLYRNKQGEVHWAYPVTSEATPHRVSFDTGEQCHAA
ncbi:MAG: hypothetical protein AB1894_13730 [Chloroflexota bacterium]